MKSRGTPIYTPTGCTLCGPIFAIVLRTVQSTTGPGLYREMYTINFLQLGQRRIATESDPKLRVYLLISAHSLTRSPAQRSGRLAAATVAHAACSI